MLSSTRRTNFFTQPSLAFFDGATAFKKPRTKVFLNPHNYVQSLQQYMKADWTVIPQPRPASSTTLLFVKNSKVFGRLRAPPCVPIPRQDVPEGGATKDQLIDFFESNNGTWLLACTDRAIGCAVFDKDGQLEKDTPIKTFSLLVDHNKGANSSSAASSSLGPAEYDDPGFVRPGSESPMYEEFFSWVSSNSSVLENCVNWCARRDDGDHIMWDHLKQMQRKTDLESRQEAVISAASSSSEGGSGGTNEDEATAIASNPQEFARHAWFGGHDVGTAEASAAASQWASERCSLLDQRKWVIIPPSLMPERDLRVHRNPNQINMLSAAARMRQGILELL